MGKAREAMLPAGALALMAFAIMASARADEFRGPLERPSALSERSARSMLLGIAPAGTRLVAVGERGIVLLSDDAGVSWRQAKVPVSVSLVAARFASPRDGWAVGHLGVVLHTVDGGETWHRQLDGAEAARLIREDARLRRERAGRPTKALEQALEAAQLLVDDGADKPLLDVLALDDRHAVVVGSYGLILRTDDAGRSWQPLTGEVDNPDGFHFYAAAVIGAHTYLAGESGHVFRAGPGERLTPLAVPYEGTFFGVLPAGSHGLLVFGLRGHAYRSDDEGRSWQAIETGIATSLVAGVELRNGELALVSQSGDVLLSGDRGRSFERVSGVPERATAGAAEAPDGALVTVGAGGARRIPLPPISSQGVAQ